MEIMSRHTRFRGYQLKTKGSSFSYWDGTSFILGEARYNDDNKKSIWHELKRCGKNSITTLHITSWDADHCISTELASILLELKPSIIEYPGYEINNEKQNQIDCLRLIQNYVVLDQHVPKLVSANKLDSNYISGLSNATDWSYNNIIFNNKKDYPEPNNNSSIKLFRSGSFSLLSLGDLEKEEISKWLIQYNIIKNEVDILIMAHHGSDNGFTTDDFLKAVKPKVAICLCDYGNQYEHPSQNVLRLLRENNILYYSTKQGDIIIESINDHTTQFQLWNYVANGDRLESESKPIFTKRA